MIKIKLHKWTYQYKKGLHFSALARWEVSRHSQVENVKPDCSGHFEMGGKVMACHGKYKTILTKSWPRNSPLL